MTRSAPPTLLDATFARVLESTKADFVTAASAGTILVHQHGAARVDTFGRPPWPEFGPLPDKDHAVIETFVCRPGEITPTGADESAIDAWMPMVEFVDTAVKSALSGFGVDLHGDAYATTSITPRVSHEGVPHVDDDRFRPDEDVGIVAIIGSLAGPRVARSSLAHGPVPFDGQLDYTDAVKREFESGATPQTACGADELVLFPQFGQLHAGPDAAELGPTGTDRLLLVYRGRVRSRAAESRVNPRPAPTVRRRSTRGRNRPRT